MTIQLPTTKRAFVFLFVSLFLFTGAGCTLVPNTNTPTNITVTDTSVTNKTVPSKPNPSATNGAQPTQGQGQKSGQGPYTHEIRTATSADGLTWQNVSDEPLVEHASVPAVIVRSDQSIVVYYVNAADGPDKLGCIQSDDGAKTFTTENCSVTDAAVDHQVDFSIVQLSDGRYRLYYFGSAGFTGDPASDDSDHYIYSAVSDDGITFVDEGEVFAYPGLVDPDVFWNGSTWVMHVFSITEHETVVATSDSGLDFTFRSFFEPKKFGLAKPVTLADGTFRMYAFKQGEQVAIYSFTSTDGFAWTQEDGTRLAAPEGYEITDPSVVQRGDGIYHMFYKISPKLAQQ